jgi:hypothetical protein
MPAAFVTSSKRVPRKKKRREKKKRLNLALDAWKIVRFSAMAGRFSEDLD